jgi:hypothetical protein
MDVRIEGPIDEAAALRSWIYAFLSRLAAGDGPAESDFFSVTLIPTGDQFVCNLKFQDPVAGTAFIDHLPAALKRNVVTFEGAPRPPPVSALLSATAQ